MAKKYKRIVGQIERCFITLSEEDKMGVLALTEIKDWIDNNTRGGMTKMRLANFLNKRPQFKLVRRIRKRGSTETESFWGMSGISDKEYRPEPMSGWVVECLADDRCNRCIRCLNRNNSITSNQ
tara:strand:- start:2580 stop:2951 length:372 start_codon:yes stop_codon:yes gene_type:complete